MDFDRRDLVRGGRLTRRGFLGAAGAVGLAGSSALLGGPLAGSAAADARASRTPLATPLKGLVGATVLPQSLAEANTFDSALGAGNPNTYPLARTVQKWYFKKGTFPTAPSPTMATLSNAGCQFILCYKPSFAPPYKDKAALNKSLKAMKHHGVKGRVVLWQEPQDPKNHLKPGPFRAMVEAYHETVHAYYELDYNAAFTQGSAATVDYCPDAAYIDRIAVDFYGNDYYSTKFKPPNRIADLENHANTIGKPFGIYEFGLTDDAKHVPIPKKAAAFYHYLYAAMVYRVTHGRQNADILWWDGGTYNDPATHSNQRTALREFYTNLSSAA